jgi:hypothetical protein
VTQKFIEAILVWIDFLATKVAQLLSRRPRVAEIIKVIEDLLMPTKKQIDLCIIIVCEVTPRLVLVLDLQHADVVLVASVGSNFVTSSVNFPLLFVEFNAKDFSIHHRRRNPPTGRITKSEKTMEK